MKPSVEELKIECYCEGKTEGHPKTMMHIIYEEPSVEKKIEEVLQTAVARMITEPLKRDKHMGIATKYLLSLIQKEREKEREKVKMMGYIDSNNVVQPLDEDHVKEFIRIVLEAIKK